MNVTDCNLDKYSYLNFSIFSLCLLKQLKITYEKSPNLMAHLILCIYR